MEIPLSADAEAFLQQQAALAGLNIEQYASQLIQQEIEYQAVQEGLADVEAGRATSLEQFESDFRKQQDEKPNA